MYTYSFAVSNQYLQDEPACNWWKPGRASKISFVYLHLSTKEKLLLLLPPPLISFSPWSELCWPQELLHAQADNNSTLWVTIMHIFFIIKSHHYMLLPWRACTRENRTLLLTHHTLWHVLVALATGRSHRNFSDQLLPCTEARFQILCCRIAWQNLASKLRDFCIYKLLVFSPYHAWGKKEKSNVTDPLLHRSKRSFRQDHNTYAT
jgi:hypothetical protein